MQRKYNMMPLILILSLFPISLSNVRSTEKNEWELLRNLTALLTDLLLNSTDTFIFFDRKVNLTDTETKIMEIMDFYDWKTANIHFELPKIQWTLLRTHSYVKSSQTSSNYAKNILILQTSNIKQKINIRDSCYSFAYCCTILEVWSIRTNMEDNLVAKWHFDELMYGTGKEEYWVLDRL